MDYGDLYGPPWPESTEERMKKYGDVRRAMEPKTDQQVIVTRDHVEMIERRHLWSYGGTVLPLKRRRHHPDGDTGCIYNIPGEPKYRVRLGNMFSVALDGQRVEDMPIRDYPNAASIVADGWEAD